MIDELSFSKVPYLKDGRGMDGADCYGFARLVASAFGIDWPLHNDISVVSRTECAEFIAGQIDACWVPVRRGKPGDAVHMWSIEKGKRLDLHVGTIVKTRHLMHLEEIGGVQSVPLNHHSIENRILGIYRLHG